MKTLYHIESQECLGLAEGVERVFNKMPPMTTPEILSKMESALNNIKLCTELGFSDGTLVGYLNHMGALIVKQLQNMEMV